MQYAWLGVVVNGGTSQQSPKGITRLTCIVRGSRHHPQQRRALVTIPGDRWRHASSPTRGSPTHRWFWSGESRVRFVSGFRSTRVRSPLPVISLSLFLCLSLAFPSASLCCSVFSSRHLCSVNTLSLLCVPLHWSFGRSVFFLCVRARFLYLFRLRQRSNSHFSMRRLPLTAFVKY